MNGELLARAIQMDSRVVCIIYITVWDRYDVLQHESNRIVSKFSIIVPHSRKSGAFRSNNSRMINSAHDVKIASFFTRYVDKKKAIFMQIGDR